MIAFIRRLLDSRRQARLEHLSRLAAATDELLIGGRMTPDTRLRLQTARDRLESQIREMLLHLVR